MRERTPEFLAAQDRVKVGHFTRQGFDLEGVIHVGANGGLEIKYYLELGSPKVLGFEPLTSASRQLEWMFEDDDRVGIVNMGLGNKTERRVLNVTAGDGQGSSFLKEIDGPYTISSRKEIYVIRFLDYAVAQERWFRIGDYNTLVVDVQGMELEVLKGFDILLPKFSFLNIECSEKSLYEGGVDAQVVVDYLDSTGFQQDSPIVSHDDIMFIKKGLK